MSTYASVVLTGSAAPSDVSPITIPPIIKALPIICAPILISAPILSVPVSFAVLVSVTFLAVEGIPSR